MIKIFRLIGEGPAAGKNWVVGSFADNIHALDEYNSEVRRARNEGIDDGRPELEIIEDRREVEYWLVEEEATHTAETRDAMMEIARWGLAKKSV